MKEDELEKLCKREPRCHCPERHVVLSKTAETPEYLRRYFKEIGRQEIKKKIIEDIEEILGNYQTCFLPIVKELEKLRWKLKEAKE